MKQEIFFKWLLLSIFLTYMLIKIVFTKPKIVISKECYNPASFCRFYFKPGIKTTSSRNSLYLYRDVYLFCETGFDQTMLRDLTKYKEDCKVVKYSNDTGHLSGVVRHDKF